MPGLRPVFLLPLPSRRERLPHRPCCHVVAGGGQGLTSDRRGDRIAHSRAVARPRESCGCGRRRPAALHIRQQRSEPASRTQTSRREPASHELPARGATGPRRSTAKPSWSCRRSATGSEVSTSAIRAKRVPGDWSEVLEAGRAAIANVRPAGQAGALQSRFARRVRDAVDRDAIAFAIACQSLTSTGHDRAAGTAGKSPEAYREWERKRRRQPRRRSTTDALAEGDFPAGPALTIVARRRTALRSKATQRRRHLPNPQTIRFTRIPAPASRERARG